MKEEGEYSFMSIKKMKKSNYNSNQRRFSDEQIKSLEMMFESETRLEPKKKVQLARELGLQPRQVGIWFQNKRARWKSKQLETEYNILRQNYDNLASQFESLKKEKQSLVSQLQRLKEAMQKTEEEKERQCCCGDEAVVPALSKTDHESENKETPSCEPEMYEKDQHRVLCDHDNDDDDNIKREYFGGFEEESDHLMNIVEPADSCLTSSDDWGGFKLDQSNNNYSWWDVWS